MILWLVPGLKSIEHRFQILGLVVQELTDHFFPSDFTQCVKYSTDCSRQWRIPWGDFSTAKAVVFPMNSKVTKEGRYEGLEEVAQSWIKQLWPFLERLELKRPK